MKNLVAFAMSFMMIGNGFGSTTPQTVIEEIQENVIIDLDGIELDEYNEDYVMVNFRVIDSKILIQEINGTDQRLKDKIIKELYELNVRSSYNPEKTYIVKFTFDQV